MTPERSATVYKSRRRLSMHGGSALFAMLVPAVCFPLGLFLLHDDPRFAWLRDFHTYPWELWVVVVCGTTATLGGFLDWRFHRVEGANSMITSRARRWRSQRASWRPQRSSESAAL